jgi:uroporphyrinogen III methyltransferase/synthase
MRALGRVRIAVIGPGTAEELKRYSLRADLVPVEYRAEALAAELAALADSQSFLLVRASRGREILADTLRATGNRVEQVVAYDSRDAVVAAPEVAQALDDGLVDWTTVTSSAIARSLVRLFGASLRKTRLASISPITSATLQELGYAPAAEAWTYTMSGLIDAIQQAQR